MDESMKDDPDGRFHSNSDEFDKVLCDVEMLIDRELGNTWNWSYFRLNYKL